MAVVAIVAIVVALACCRHAHSAKNERPHLSLLVGDKPSGIQNANQDTSAQFTIARQAATQQQQQQQQ